MHSRTEIFIIEMCEFSTFHYHKFQSAHENEVWRFFQIAVTLRDVSTIKREERPLRLLKDAGRKTILTLDRELPAVTNEIEYVNLIDWLEDDDLQQSCRPPLHVS